MTSRILIVEDEIFVALEVESVALSLGLEPVGIAADSRRAMQLAQEADLAFVDFNLKDGRTGIEVGRRLADQGVTVMFMTATPEQLETVVPGVIGVLPKPSNGSELKAALRYAAAVHENDDASVSPPRRLKLFGQQATADMPARAAG